MARFVAGDALNASLINLIKNADEFLYLISPYIKLHSRIEDQLKLKKGLPNLQIVVVFGKAEEGQSNRISESDLALLTDFPNIEIRYKKNLHAKYYASEDGALITSLNLYDFSQNNNIEAGVWMETRKSLIGKLTNWNEDLAPDKEAFEFFKDVISTSDLLFKREPIFDSSFGMSHKILKSKTTIDDLEVFFSRSKVKVANLTRLESTDKRSKFQSVLQAKPHTGFCIRTGKEIRFDVDKPLSAEAYKSWSRYQDQLYKEKYCHFSGEASDGQTSFAHPILKKNWRKAKDLFKF